MFITIIYSLLYIHIITRIQRRYSWWYKRNIIYSKVSNWQ